MIGIMVSAIGLMGYSTVLAEDYSKNLRTNLIFCMLTSSAFLLYGILYLINFSLADYTFALILSFAGLYLLLSFRIEGINAERFRNGLVYASLVWLIARNLYVGIYIPAVIAMVAVPVFYFAVRSVRELDGNEFYFFDETDIVYTAFLVILIGGIAIESMRTALAISSALALYIFYRLYKSARFLI